jgi:hypothetical protein
MRNLFLIPLVFGFGCTVERPIKIAITIIDSGAPEFPDEFEPSGEQVGEPSQDGQPTNEPAGDPNGGDPVGEPTGEPSGNPEPAGETGGEPAGETGGETGGGSPGVFDSCDAAIYCLYAGQDAMNVTMYFSEQNSCTESSSDSTYDDWFTCMATDKGDPCSGAGGGNWGGCNCEAIQTCTDNNTDPFDGL